MGHMGHMGRMGRMGGMGSMGFAWNCQERTSGGGRFRVAKFIAWEEAATGGVSQWEICRLLTYALRAAESQWVNQASSSGVMEKGGLRARTNWPGSPTGSPPPSARK